MDPFGFFGFSNRGFGQSYGHNQRTVFFELYKCFPAAFFGKDEVEKGNMSEF
jgi:hypothetical protein